VISTSPEMATGRLRGTVPTEGGCWRGCARSMMSSWRLTGEAEPADHLRCGLAVLEAVKCVVLGFVGEFGVCELVTPTRLRHVAYSGLYSRSSIPSANETVRPGVNEMGAAMSLYRWSP
jgi:hypothetical protein